MYVEHPTQPELTLSIKSLYKRKKLAGPDCRAGLDKQDSSQHERLQWAWK